MYTILQLSSIIKFGLRWFFGGFTSIDIVKFALPSIVLQTQKRDDNPTCHTEISDGKTSEIILKFWNFVFFHISKSSHLLKFLNAGGQPGGRFYWGKTFWGRTQRGLHRETAPRMKRFLFLIFQISEALLNPHIALFNSQSNTYFTNFHLLYVFSDLKLGDDRCLILGMKSWLDVESTLQRSWGVRTLQRMGT